MLIVRNFVSVPAGKQNFDGIEPLFIYLSETKK